MRTMPTWPVAAGSLVAGFAVAVATGVRPIGGLVLLAGLAFCVPRWRRLAGTGRAVALTAFYAVAFVVSHVIADTVSAWGAVAIVAAAVAAATWAGADAADRPPSAAADAP